RHLQAAVSWELPGGGAQAGEDPMTAAQRELREEGGYRAERFAFLTRFYPSNAYLDEVAYCYAAYGLTPDPLPADDDEFIERRVVPLPAAGRMPVDGDITEPASNMTLLRPSGARLCRWSAQARAWWRSSIRSSGCARPIDSRKRFSGVRVPGPSIDARCSTRLSVPPKLVARVNPRSFAATCTARAWSPRTCTDTIPPNAAI